MINRFEKFSFFLSEISRSWHKIAADEMEPYGLKGPYAVYFTALYRYPNGLPAARLGELCAKDKADVSRAVSLLIKKGLVAKAGEQSYRALLKLTPKGEELAEQINQKAEAAVAGGGRGLNEEQRRIFYQALEQISANLLELSKNGLEAKG